MNKFKVLAPVFIFGLLFIYSGKPSLPDHPLPPQVLDQKDSIIQHLRLSNMRTLYSIEDKTRAYERFNTKDTLAYN